IEGIARDAGDLPCDGVIRHERPQEHIGDFREAAGPVKGGKRNDRPLFGDIKAAVGRQALRQGGAKAGGRCLPASTDELHGPTTRAPEVVMGTIQSSTSLPAALNASTMAR